MEHLFMAPTLTAKVRQVIINTVSAGNHVEVGAKAARVDPRVVARWLERGRREWDRIVLCDLEEPAASEQPFVDFYLDLQEAEAVAERNAVLVLRKAMRGERLERGRPDARAATDFLRRRFPERWGDAVAAASRRELPRSQARELLAEMLGCRPDELPADQRPN